MGIQESSMKFEYIAKSKFGGDYIEVRKNGLPIGKIRENEVLGVFQYYRGMTNELTPEFQERSLDALKARIE